MITIIPARGGSKRLPGKNMARIGGSTLVELAIRCAQEARLTPIVSTDCPQIAAEAFRCGAIVIRRPAELATDDATTQQVVLDAVDQLDLAYDDIIVLLQPTSPLRTVDDVRRSLAEFTYGGHDCPIMTVAADSQAPNGSVYVFRVHDVLRPDSGSIVSNAYPIPMDPERSIDIDTAEDLARAQEWWCRKAVA